MFARRLVLMLGEQEINEDHESLPRSKPAMAQGRHRLERWLNFFQAARSQAEAMGTPLAWLLVTVPGVGHGDVGIAKTAVKYLFDNARL